MDRSGTIAVTGSLDKTVRVWRLADGALQRTIRMPTGPGDVGKIYAVALSPDSQTIAASGWTAPKPPAHIDLFDTATGAQRARLGGLPNVVNHLAFSPDGTRLAAALAGANGVRLFAKSAAGAWTEAARDVDYGADSYGIAFAADGRFATTSRDGQIRLYSAEGRLLRAAESGFARPFGLAFNPRDGRLAVGFLDTTAVRLFDGETLAPLPAPNVSGIDNGNLSSIAWSADGGTLFAAGRYAVGGTRPVVAWGEDGTRVEHAAGLDTAMSLKPLGDGGLLVAAADPYLAVLDADGMPRWPPHRPVQMDPRAQHRNLGLSADGMTVDFSFDYGGKRRARFDLASLTLTTDPADDGRTSPPRQQGLAVDDWVNAYRPTLNGTPLSLERFERSRALAIHPDGDRFLLGTEYWLRAYDDAGALLWRRPVPAVAWAVNIAADGRLAVAAYDDGTIRWHDMASGTELLAFFPFNDGTDRWVVWTPERYYYSSPGAGDALGWTVNRGWDAPADFYPITAFPGFFAPDAIPFVLEAMETPRALGLAKLARDRKSVKERVNSAVPPGPQLHVLTIGVSRYKHHDSLKLDFADDDAIDLAKALLKQEGALYAHVHADFLTDEEATERAIGKHLSALTKRMTPDQNDVAVIHFSGHGEKIDGEYYLLPHDVEAGDPSDLNATGIHIGELRRALGKMGERGKVLVLLDACHSGEVTDGAKSALPPDIEDVQRELAEAGNGVVVLSSSTGREKSVEHPDWRNGAFTEAVLDALAGGSDDGDGWLTITELSRHVQKKVRELTDNAQNPTITVIGEHLPEARLFWTSF